MRKKIYSIVVGIVILIFADVYAGAFSFYVSNDFYLYEDKIDTTKKGGDLFFDAGINLSNVGGSGFSFNSDVKVANNCYVPVLDADYRSPYEIISGYLEWMSSNNSFMLRGGRQQYTNLLSEYFSIDGLRVELQPIPHRIAINLVGGSIAPVPYLTRVFTTKDSQYIEDSLAVPVRLKDTTISIMSNRYPFFSDKGILFVDGIINIGATNNISIGAGFVPLIFERKIVKYDSLDTIGDSQQQDTINAKITKEKYDFRVAVGGDFSPLSFFKINGSGRFSLIQGGFDRYDLRIKLLPSSAVELVTYVIGENGRIDSTNYFSIMFYKQVTEWGTSFNFFPSENSSVELDYHLTNVNKEGSDHFFSFNASTEYLSGGVTLGIGAHGFTFRPYGGFELPFLKFFSLVGNAEYYRVDETDDDNVHHMTLFSGGLKANFYPIGLTIYPRVEYINNRYYKQDVRFLLTTSLVISGFKGSDK